MAGYKLKSKSSAKKRFNFTSKGKIKCKHAKLRHILTKKSPSMKRRLRAAGQIAPADVPSIKRMLPYG
ncbi:MAG: 50S ribosomal protein L35 [Deltaproteobacteria bacterium]|mgnify:CR=1|jgi:large subunit ribosomal protein L35|nr:50S ribosomal protein L35 [Deltaproteobacteria bacterium]